MLKGFVKRFYKGFGVEIVFSWEHGIIKTESYFWDIKIAYGRM